MDELLSPVRTYERTHIFLSQLSNTADKLPISTASSGTTFCFTWLEDGIKEVYTGSENIEMKDLYS